jgi:hypothetical protein
MRPLIADLQQLLHSLPASAMDAQRGDGNGSDQEHDAAESQDEEVIDAEFTRD